MTEGQTYEDGLQEGKLQALERMTLHHADRIDHHEKRLQMQERITYGILGAIAFIEFWPKIEKLIGG